MSDLNLKWLADNFNHSNNAILYIGAAELGWAVRVRQAAPLSRVYAFECNDYWINNFPIFQTAKDNDINYYHLAVSDTVGKISFLPSNMLNGQTWALSGSIFDKTTYLESIGLTFSEKCTVDSTTIEHFCNENNINPDFVHIDVQGAEYKVFQKLGNYRPKAIWAEICEFDKYDTGVTLNQFKQLMSDLGYSLKYESNDGLFVHESATLTEYTPKDN